MMKQLALGSLVATSGWGLTTALVIGAFLLAPWPTALAFFGLCVHARMNRVQRW